MSKKITNGENVNNFQKRKYLRWGIIGTSLLTIILAFLYYVINLGIGYALVSFFITIILKRMYNKTEIEISEELKKMKEEKKKKKNNKKVEKKSKKGMIR